MREREKAESEATRGVSNDVIWVRRELVREKEKKRKKKKPGKKKKIDNNKIRN